MTSLDTWNLSLGLTFSRGRAVTRIWPWRNHKLTSKQRIWKSTFSINQSLLAPRKSAYVLEKANHSWELGPRAKMNERIVKQATGQKKLRRVYIIKHILNSVMYNVQSKHDFKWYICFRGIKHFVILRALRQLHRLSSSNNAIQSFYVFYKRPLIQRILQGFLKHFIYCRKICRRDYVFFPLLFLLLLVV